jgi:hypothetical protein
MDSVLNQATEGGAATKKPKALNKDIICVQPYEQHSQPGTGKASHQREEGIQRRRKRWHHQMVVFDGCNRFFLSKSGGNGFANKHPKVPTSSKTTKTKLLATKLLARTVSADLQ